VTTPDGFTQYYVVSGLSEIVATGPDGNLWFSSIDMGAGSIGNISTSGVLGPRIAIAAGPNRFADHGITAGPDGGIWFTESRNVVARVGTDGTLREYALPPSAQNPLDIIPGPDGALWFAEGTGVARIDPATGSVAAFATPSGQAASGITVGSDKKVWFTEPLANRVGRIDPTTHSIAEFSLPPGVGSPTEISSGPDGNLWLTSGSSSSGPICRMTPTGAATVFPAPSIPSGTAIAGPDSAGNMWFVGDLSTMGKITP
jgi:virginiamycin B lyase